MSSAFDLTGKVALVTGANTGLGQGLAVGLAAAGADIVAAGRSTPSETEAAVKALGRKFAFVPADFSKPSMAGDVAAKAETPFGPINILVNNAGTIKRNDALDFTESDWDEVMDVNLKSVFFLSQAVARSMVAGGDGGKIINIASMLSFQGGIRVASYTSSKSGVAGLTKLLANEWAKHGINVNAIACRGGRVPCVGRFGLCARNNPRRGRRLARALVRGSGDRQHGCTRHLLRRIAAAPHRAGQPAPAAILVAGCLHRRRGG